ncbi:fumarylacetoacetate hydrolase family protein [Pigmentiphaga sp.]|uniref:fumarylacetoacetate hydrolase family protein n=1 Tax=Pigmentiphaga sp. TaxID=1977564 RepID=UPI0025D22437|nr:fumarylacetoacetate hydrolase family protein [Pigmentiphaga sp.]
MKFVSFIVDNEPSYGLADEGGIIDLRPVFGNRAADLKALIAAGLLREAARARAAGVLRQPGEVRLLPVIPNPGKIVCAGLNYADHVLETGRQVTEDPVLFLRVPESQAAHGEDIILPPESDRLDYEGEIAVIVGKGGRRIAEEAAWDHIAGYACYNDGSLRDWQTSTSQWTAGKNFWRTGAFGPWMVTADEIPPDRRMTLTTRLNGVEMQRATSDMLIHSIPRLIAYISTFMPIGPGDVIVTGTPGGVGMKRTPPVFMKEGDIVEVEVDAIGVLRNGIGRG